MNPQITASTFLNKFKLYSMYKLSLSFIVSTFCDQSLQSVRQFSSSVVSDSLRPHEPQHTRPPCPSPTPRVHPNPCPLCRWFYPTFLSSVIPFSSCPQSFQVSGSFQMSQLSASGGQSIGISASTSVPPMNTQDWSPLGWTGWISLQSKGLLQHHSSKASILRHSAFFIVQLSHPYMTTGKTIALTRWTFVGKVMSLLFNMLSRLVITFVPRSKRLFISWLRSPSAVIWEPKNIKSLTVSIVSPSICQEVMGLDAMILVFWMLSFKPMIHCKMEKAMATHSSTLAWKIPCMEGPSRLQSMGSLGVGHDRATSLSLFTFMQWRRKWQPTPVFLPGESQGRGTWWAAVYGVTQSRIWLKWLSSSTLQNVYIAKWLPP